MTSARTKPATSAAHRRQPPGLEQGCQPVVHRGLGDGTEREGADGDPELGAGQQQGQLAGAAQGGPG